MKLGMIIVVSSLALTGCGSGTLPCNDKSIKKTVLKTIVDKVNISPWAKETIESGKLGKYAIRNVKTLNHKKDIDVYSCAASLNFEFNGKPQHDNFTYKLSYFEDLGETEVVVSGIDEIKNKMITMVMLDRMKQ